MAIDEKFIDTIKNLYGASNTSLKNLNSGALANLLSTERKPLDPALISLIGFSEMTKQASQPGATAVGAFGSGVEKAATTQLASNLADRKSDATDKTSALTFLSKLATPKTKTRKGTGEPTLVNYMTKADAITFLKNKGLPESAPTFNYLVGKLSTNNKSLIGTPIRQDGTAVGFQIITEGNEVVDGSILPFSSGGKSLLFTSRLDEIKKLNKYSAEELPKLTSLIPNINTVLPVLLDPNVETGFFAGKFLPVRQALTEILGLDRGDIDDLQLLQSASNKLAPLMRPAGSGSTSDLEFDAYRKAVLDIGQGKYANYLNLYALKKVTENGIKLIDLRKSLLADENLPNDVIQARIKKFDTGIWEKFPTHKINKNQEFEALYDNEEEQEVAFDKWFNNLPVGAVMLNRDSRGRKLQDNLGTYIIKLPSQDGKPAFSSLGK